MPRGRTLEEAQANDAQAAVVPAIPQPIGIVDRLAGSRQQLEIALPEGVSVDRYIRTVKTLVRENPDLGKCDPGTVLGAVFTCAQLGLELTKTLGEAHIIPFFNKRKGVHEATLIIGYQGLRKLVLASGLVSHIEAYEIRRNDDFTFALGTNPHVHHTWDILEDRGEVVAFYGVAHLADGSFVFQEPWSVRRMEEHRDQFAQRTGPRSPWADHFESMSLKTVIRMLAKRLPQGATVSAAMRIDGAVRTQELGRQVPAITVVSEAVQLSEDEEQLPVIDQDYLDAEEEEEYR